jgi:hypothetical protein
MTRYHICIYDIFADRSYCDSIFHVSVDSIHDGLLIMYYLNEALLVMHINYYMDNIHFNMFLLLFQNKLFFCVFNSFFCEYGYTEILFLV